MNQESENIPLTGDLSSFGHIQRINSAGVEYWSSRDFAIVLGYSDYRNFEAVLGKARLACLNSGHWIEDHFVDVTEMVTIVSRGQGKRISTSGGTS
jgi:DNA-damage-inducible protein D